MVNQKEQKIKNYRRNFLFFTIFLFLIFVVYVTNGFIFFVSLLMIPISLIMYLTFNMRKIRTNCLIGLIISLFYIFLFVIIGIGIFNYSILLISWFIFSSIISPLYVETYDYMEKL